MKKITLLFLAALLLCGCTAAPEETRPAETAPVMAPEVTETQAATIPAAPQPESFLLTFAGDCTLGSNPHNYYAGYGFPKTVGEDWRYPFANVISWFEQDDLTLVNLEGPLCDDGSPVIKRHTFRGPRAYVNVLTENSVEAVSLANNHTQDYGRRGYEATLTTLEEAGVAYVEQNSSRILTTGSGLTVGLYGATYDTMTLDNVVSGITNLKEQGVDLIIFAPHWGVEMTYTPTQAQQQIGRAAIDAGAQIVWGSHPHVLQPIEEYNGGVIFYSMSNFSFGGNIYPGDYDTALLQQEVLRAPDGSITLGKLTVIPACISSVADRNNFQPTPYAEGTEEYTRVLKKLGLEP